MVFNGDANNDDLCSLADTLVKSNDVSYPLKQKAPAANRGLRMIFAAIWEAYGGWREDDSNNSGDPEVSTDLTANTSSYAFATAQAIFGMECADAQQYWHNLKPITLEEIRELGYAENEFMTTPGIPEYYRPLQNGVKLYPAPSYNMRLVNEGVAGLKAHITRDVVAFTAASTSAAPGYDSAAGHEAVAIFMALQYAKTNTKPQAGALSGDWIEALAQITRHYAKKFREQWPQNLKKARPDYASQFL